MKSVIHEASSIIKAIDQAWEKAGKPTDFSVKILEEAQKNFLGFTKRSAKIALFFDREVGQPKGFRKQAERPVTPMRRGTEQHKGAPIAPGAAQSDMHARDASKSTRPGREQPARPAVQAETAKKPVVEQQKPAKQFNPLWNDAMVTYVKSWLTDTLADMNMSSVRFTVEPSRFHLNITFSQPLLAEEAQERKLFASFALLILESLKHHFKIGLHGHKIVLAHAASPHPTTTQQQ